MVLAKECRWLANHTPEGPHYPAPLRYLCMHVDNAKVLHTFSFQDVKMQVL